MPKVFFFFLLFFSEQRGRACYGDIAGTLALFLHRQRLEMRSGRETSSEI
jgi:hypothetical protein